MLNCDNVNEAWQVLHNCFVWHKYLRRSCEYVQIAMTESMCDLTRMREWVKDEWRAKTWRKRGVDEQRRLGKNRENGIDIV